jgi:hypothetical protein
MRKKPELKVYALYSTIANKNKLKIDEVDTIHSWFLKKLVTTIKEKPMMSLHVPGMGRLSCDVNKAAHIAFFNLDVMIKYLNGGEYITDKKLEEEAYMILAAVEILNQFWEREYTHWDERKKNLIEERFGMVNLSRDLDETKYPNFNKLKKYGINFRIPDTNR